LRKTAEGNKEKKNNTKKRPVNKIHKKNYMIAFLQKIPAKKRYIKHLYLAIAKFIANYSKINKL